jgi:hypothetical protein
MIDIPETPLDPLLFMSLPDFIEQHEDLDPVGDCGLAPYNRWCEVEDAEPVWMRDVEVFTDKDVHEWWHHALDRARKAYAQATETVHMQAIAAYLSEIDAMANEARDPESVKLVSGLVLGKTRERAWARIHEERTASAKQMLLDAANGRVPTIVDSYSRRVARRVLGVLDVSGKVGV